MSETDQDSRPATGAAGAARGGPRPGGRLARLRAMIVKEFKQMVRDRLTLAIMVGVPVIQMLLFGYAINLDPRNLPTAVALGDDGPAGRAIVAAMQTSGYFDVTRQVDSGEEMVALLQSGAVQFGVEIPPDLTRRIARGDTARILLVADDTDPAAVGGAIGAMDRIVADALARDLRGVLTEMRPRSPLVEVVVHRRYNPEIDTPKVIVPGLLGVILMLSLLINTGLAVTRERERGTMEQLLSMPLHPLEIMVGKIVPYVLVGVVQTAIVLAAAFFLFHVPMRGDPVLLGLMITLFIIAALAVGYLMSTVARSQLQAMQMTIFFFLPNLLLSGFAFPFRGMPEWAQWIGEVLPLTHFVRVVRGVMLKGADAGALWQDIAVLGGFTLIVVVLGLLRFRTTLE
jgi:ABC-2 type transport system permease protein